MANESTLRALLEGMCEERDRIEAMLFTSFTFDPAFFEDNILATLCNDGNRLATPRDLTIASSWANDHNLCVFYDSAMLTNPEQRATYPAFPVSVEHGVFHPKIICALIGGERPRAELVVTSGNLSYAGWGHNREVFAAHVITDSAIAAPLVTFIDWLIARAPSSKTRLAALRAHLDALPEPTAPHPPELLVTLPGWSPTVMQRLASTRGELTIASPFFHPALHLYLAENLPGRTIALAPAKRTGGDRVSILESVIAAIDKSPDVSFYALPTDDAGRHDHLKIYRWRGDESAQAPPGVLLGSHNATEAALGTLDGAGGRQNVEISLLLPGATMDLGLTACDPPRGVTDAKDLDPDLVRDDYLDVALSVEVDWKHDVFRITTTRLPKDGELTLDLPGTQPLSLERSPSAFEHPFEESSARSLLSRKWFRVLQTDGDIERRYTGLVHELHWSSARPDFALRSLEQCLDAWLHSDLSNPREAARVGISLSASDDVEIKNALSQGGGEHGDVFNNFFQLFRARAVFMGRMCRREGESEEAWERRAMAYLKASPDSLVNVVNHTYDRHDPTSHEGWDAYAFTLTAQLQRILATLRDDGVIRALEQETLAKELGAKLDALSARWDAAIHRQLEDNPLDQGNLALPMLYERITGREWR